MDRFFLSPDGWASEALSLGGEEGHHAVRVMRKKVGDEVELFDGRGRWAKGVVREIGRSVLTVEKVAEGSDEPLFPRVELAVSVPKGKTMDLVVQKAVELGVNGIHPLITSNSVVKVGADEAEEKSAKWQRVALEACKQCGQNFLPEVAPVKRLEDYLSGKREGSKVIASLAPGAVPVRERLESLGDDSREVHLLVGPEGDFTEDETRAALAAGFEPVSLGEIVLRVETACLFLASVIRYRFG